LSLLVHARGLIDGSSTDLLEGAGLLVDQGRIVEVGPAEELSKRTHERIDLGDATMLPGFVDAHSHITIRPGEGDQHGQLRGPPVWQALRGIGNLRTSLASGVTTMRVMGEEHGIDFEFKSAIERGDVYGPRLLVAGRGLSPSHGHGASLQGVDGPADLRRAVRLNVRDGADHIKIFATGGVSSRNLPIDVSNYAGDEIRSVVDEARRAGRYVAAHAHGGEGVDLCVEEGVHSIEHGALLNDRNIDNIVKHEAWLVLTNSILFHPEGIERGDAAEPSIMDKVRVAREAVEATFERVRQAEVRIALGTDSMHGLFGYEIQWLVDHGVRALDAIAAATCRGAELIGLAETLGTLEPGKRADLVAVDGNPLEDIEAVRRVVAVIKDGELVAGAGVRLPATG
jgi:imidazolonepropionase-like amidohydrolase